MDIKMKEGRKLTLFGISSFMANTTKNEIQIKGEHDGKPIYSLRGKRKKFYFNPDEKTMIFEGWDIPIITDGERPPVPGSQPGITVTSFSGNACYNFSSRDYSMNMEELKEYIEKMQINENLDEQEKAKILFKDEKGKESVMYPELYQGNHAVIARHMQTTEIKA